MRARVLRAPPQLIAVYVYVRVRTCARNLAIDRPAPGLAVGSNKCYSTVSKNGAENFAGSTAGSVLGSAGDCRWRCGELQSGFKDSVSVLY